MKIYYYFSTLQKTKSVLVTTPISLETFEEQSTTNPGLLNSGPTYLSPGMLLLLFAIIRGSYLLNIIDHFHLCKQKIYN